MSSFIAEKAQYLFQTYGADLSEMTVVLPSRRAGLFFRYALAEELDRAIWMPKILSIEEFIGQQSGLETLDALSVLFEFYSAYKQVEGKQAEPFEQFAQWAEILLQDFNEIDRYLLDPSYVFGYLKAAKKLEKWTLEVPEKNSTQLIENYLKFWDQMGAYYQALNQHLSEQHLAYPGMAYRHCADLLDAQPSEWKKKLGSKKLVFLGLNALNKVEEKVIQFLLEEEEAEIHWDGDEYYVKQTKQEAGLFMRKHFKQWPYLQKNKPQVDKHFASQAKTIYSIGVSGNIAQAKLAGQLLQSPEFQGGELEKKALVLADEQLLLPCLQALPSSIDKVNVTMGYPLRFLPQTAFFELMFRMKSQAKKFQEEGRPFAYYHQDLIAFISHPYSQTLLGPVEDFVRKVKRGNRVFVRPSELEKAFHEAPLAGHLFADWNDNLDQGLKQTLEIIDALGRHFTKDKSAHAQLEREYLMHFYTVFKRLYGLQAKHGHLNDLGTLTHLFKNLLQQETLDFYGEPLEGLQLMGVLETRALDFEHLIICSMNEGMLPAGKSQNSLIPYDIKREIGLPTFFEKDAVYAYHFYRLLQRAKTVYLLHNTQQEGMSGAEQSRFVTQMAEELSKKYPQNIRFTSLSYSSPMPQGIQQGISKAKDAKVMEALEKIGEKGLSPTALSTYIQCPLKFYYDRLLHLREDEQVDEAADDRVLGTVVHETLELFYGPFRDSKQVLNKADLLALKPRIPQEVSRQFEQHYPNGDMSTGENRLMYEVACSFVAKGIDLDVQLLEQGSEVKVLGLEEPLERSIALEDRRVKLHGKADRRDSCDGMQRIVDYKTGSVGTSDLNPQKMEDLISNMDKSKGFQVALYQYMLGENHGPVQAGVISLKNAGNGFMGLSKGFNLEHFESDLKDLLRELFDPKVDFHQTEKPKNCTYCDFKAICGR